MATRVGKRHIDGRTFWYVAWESANRRKTLFWYVDSREQAADVRRQLIHWEAGDADSESPLDRLAAD